jgi:hypothetical protein
MAAKGATIDMRRSRLATTIAAATIGAAALAITSGSPSSAAPAQTVDHWVHLAPDDSFVPAGQADAPVACQRPAPDNRVSTQLHCMTPAQMRDAYGIPNQYGGDGQTIVLVDSFGSPTAAADLNFFAQTFNMPTPNFDQVFVGGKPGYLDGMGTTTGQGSGQNGPSSAEGWATEANLDVQWAYAMAPKGAHRPARDQHRGNAGRAGLASDDEGHRLGDRHLPGRHRLLDVVRHRRVGVRW